MTHTLLLQIVATTLVWADRETAEQRDGNFVMRCAVEEK
jgi:hypothetical protein